MIGSWTISRERLLHLLLILGPEADSQTHRQLQIARQRLLQEVEVCLEICYSAKESALALRQLVQLSCRRINILIGVVSFLFHTENHSAPSSLVGDTHKLLQTLSIVRHFQLPRFQCFICN